MTDFSDLRASFAKYSAAKEEYWDDLEQRAIELFNGFARHLEPEQPNFRGPDGKLRPYIEVGKEGLGTFEPVRRAEELQSNGKALEVLIRVSLDDDPDSFPKETFTFRIELSKAEGKYHVRLGGDASGRCLKVPASAGLEGQADLFEAMAAEIQQYLDPDKFK